MYMYTNQYIVKHRIQKMAIEKRGGAPLESLAATRKR